MIDNITSEIINYIKLMGELDIHPQNYAPSQGGLIDDRENGANPLSIPLWL